jgi:hypothetical protein
VTIVAVSVGLALYFAPYLFAELLAWLQPHTMIDPAKPELGEGRMVDDYWAVQNIDANTFAIGEPRGNTSALCRGFHLSHDALGVLDLRDLDTALTRIQSGQLPSKGFFPRRFPVNRQMTLATGFPWNNR